MSYNIQDIIKWCNENNGFVMTVLTFVYVIATIFIYRANKRSANAMIKSNIHSNDLYDQNRLIQKQNLDIQLFNDRYQLYEDIKKHLDSKINCIRTVGEIINDQKRISLLDDSNNFLKIRYLFDQSCFNQFQRLELTSRQISDLSESIYSEIKSFNKSPEFNDFNEEIRSFLFKNKLGKIDEEEFIKNCLNKYKLNSDKFYDLYKQFSDLKYQYYKDIDEYVQRIENYMRFSYLF